LEKIQNEKPSFALVKTVWRIGLENKVGVNYQIGEDRLEE
jgi:hypothetical protein